MTPNPDYLQLCRRDMRIPTPGDDGITIPEPPLDAVVQRFDHKALGRSVELSCGTKTGNAP